MPCPCNRCVRDLAAVGAVALAISAVGGVLLAWWLVRQLPDFSALGL